MGVWNNTAELKALYEAKRDLAIKKYNGKKKTMKKNYKTEMTEVARKLDVTLDTSLITNFNDAITAAKYNYGDADKYIRKYKGWLGK